SPRRSEVMERREAPGVCETPWELARLPWQVLCEGTCPRSSGVPSGPPPGMRSPSDVGACASRRSTDRCRDLSRYRPRKTATPHLRRPALGLLRLGTPHELCPSAKQGCLT